MAELFSDPAERTIASLEIPQLNEEEEIRAAARFAFPRLLSVLGSRMLPQFSRWIEGLCSRNSTRDEISTFLRLLEQVIFGFKEEIFPILDRLLQPLLQRLLGAVSISAEGTDDEIFVAELRREYLSFILITLNNDLDKVFISESEW